MSTKKDLKLAIMAGEKSTNLLVAAAKMGDTAEVLRLIPLANPKAYNSKALRMAAEHGHTECVRLLIPVSDPHANKGYALRHAAAGGHTECVRLLIPVSDSSDRNEALICAASLGRPECVKLLIPVCDPKTNNSAALQKAVTHLHQSCIDTNACQSCIDLLYPVSDPYAALHQLQRDHPTWPQWWKELEQRIANEQNQLLRTHIQEYETLIVKRKM